jgi:hypothetical protein
MYRRKYMIKKIGSIISIFAAIFLLLYIFREPIIRRIETRHLSEKKVISTFEKNIDAFNNIANLMQTDNRYITIDIRKDQIRIVGVGDDSKLTLVKITNDKLKEQILTMLYKIKFKHISETDDVIFFERNSQPDFGQGILFSKNGIKPYRSDIEIINLIEGNWYYYEYKQNY